VQPQEGVAPVLAALTRAQKSIDLTIFRLDRSEVVDALGKAVTRGVAVRALIAHTNSGGEKALRKLELKLLALGVTVARSADDFARYHPKFIVIDRDTLYLLGFNLVKADIQSRSFGLVVEDDTVVREVERLFEADLLKQDYTPRHDALVVSPDNARERLAEFIREAREDLAIYDARLSDRAMLRLLQERQKAGVNVRVLGRCAKSAAGRLRCARLARYRLHIRAIVRDGEQAFVGSQSLRKAELDERREVGMLISHRPTVRRILNTFDEDWLFTEEGKADAKATAKEGAGVSA